VAMLMLPVEWSVCAQDRCLFIPPYLGGSVDIMVDAGGINLHL
jgi:hypothetical protein